MQVRKKERKVQECPANTEVQEGGGGMRHSRHQSSDSPIAHGGPLHSRYLHYSPELIPHHTRQTCHGRIVTCGGHTLRQVFLTDSGDDPCLSSSDATSIFNFIHSTLRNREVNIEI